MQYLNLGRSRLSVSRICLGTMNFGPVTSESDSFAIMDRALELGINFFDTANVYGWKTGEGVTEKLIGRWFQQGGMRRENVVLATKVYLDMGIWPNTSRLSALHITKACEDSLRRLKTDYIDLYQMHHVDTEAGWDEIWQAMENLVRSGKVIYVGSSNFAAWNIVQANETAKNRHFMGLVSEQSHYNLLTRLIELEVLPACQAYGLGIIPYSPLGGGLLGGILKKTKEGRPYPKIIQEKLKKCYSQIKSWEKLCTELNEEPGSVATAWLLNQVGVTAPIIGPRTMNQFEGSVKSLKIKLSTNTMKMIDKIFPGPGGPAPKAYAW